MSQHDDTGHEARDREIEQTQDAESSSSSRLFDIRRVIGLLFTLYGVLVTIAGIVDGDAARKQAAGIDINLWTGIGMLVLGLAMLLWMRVSPFRVEAADDADSDDDAGDRRPTH